jgi:hypothetical protein
LTYLVCKHKDDGTLFITTRKSRETMLSVLIDLGQEIPSKVLKDCNSYGEAEKYKKEYEQSDGDINKILNP